MECCIQQRMHRVLIGIEIVVAFKTLTFFVTTHSTICFLGWLMLCVCRRLANGKALIKMALNNHKSKAIPSTKPIIRWLLFRYQKNYPSSPSDLSYIQQCCRKQIETTIAPKCQVFSFEISVILQLHETLVGNQLQVILLKI